MPTTEISFGVTTVISSTEGGWDELQLGMINPAYQFEGLANVDGELAKPVSSKGCEHSITVHFIDLQVSSVASILARIKSLRTKGVQTLSVPEWPDIPNCIYLGAKPTGQRTARYTVPSGSGTVTATARKNLSFELTFRQLYE